MNHIVFVMPWMSIAMVGNMDLGESLKKIELVCRMLDLYPRCKVAEHRVHWRGRADCLCDQAGCRGADLKTALETNGFWGGIPNRGLLLPFTGFLLKILTFCEIYNPYHTYLHRDWQGESAAARISRCKFLKPAAFRQSSPFWSPVCCNWMLEMKSRKAVVFLIVLVKMQKRGWMAAVVLGKHLSIFVVCCPLSVFAVHFCRTSFRSQCSVKLPMRRPRPRARTFLPTRQVCLPHDTCVTQKSHLWKLFCWGPDAPSSDTSWCVWCWRSSLWCWSYCVEPVKAFFQDDVSLGTQVRATGKACVAHIGAIARETKSTKTVKQSTLLNTCWVLTWSLDSKFLASFENLAVRDWDETLVTRIYRCR